MAAPFVYCRPSDGGNSENALLKAALDGNLDRIKGIVKSLGIGNGDQPSVFSFKKGALGVLHCAACQGHMDVCKYLVEELGADPNMTGDVDPLFEGMTPFMAAAQSGDLSTVKYFLDHGGDPMISDAGGRTVLHYAVCTGSCKVTEFLLSKGIPVDIDCGYGTPLYHAATNEQDKTMKILWAHHANPNTIVSSGIGSPLMSSIIYRSLKCLKLLIKAGADVNGKGCLMPPLVLATVRGGCTDFIRLLLKAGADPNVPDGDKDHAEGTKATIKSQAHLAFRRKEYELASKLYSSVIDFAPDATLYSNMSLCKLKMGDGEGALSDAYQCRMMRPDWAKASYRQAAAHMLLKEYKQACDAFLDAQKLDPGNDEVERELKKAMELMKSSPDEDQQ